MHTEIRSFFLRLYNSLWRLALPLLRRNKRLKEGFAERLHPQFPPVDIWIQAASGGEAYLVRELLDALAAQHPHKIRVLCSTWTRQGREVLEATPKKASLDLYCAWMPFDTSIAMRQALQQARPRLVVLLETELWPALLAACVEYAVPVLVLNARMTTKSAHSYALLKCLAPAFWHQIAPAHVAAISPEDAQRFARLFDLEPASSSDFLQTARASVMPNIKFDRALRTLEAQSGCPSPASPLSLFFVQRAQPVVLLASVRTQEEALLVPLIAALHSQCPQALVIIAPRHMSRIKKWQKLLPHALCASQLVAPPDATTQVPLLADSILWDRFGELGQLYAHANAVFVGGSLVPLGGQNFLEALTMGRIPCVGTHLQNFSWALHGLAEAQLLHICPDTRSLQSALLQNLHTSPDPQQVQARFRQWLQQHHGGSACAAQLITKYSA